MEIQDPLESLFLAVTVDLGCGLIWDYIQEDGDEVFGKGAHIYGRAFLKQIKGVDI